jgi:hypothetical protein
VRELKKFVVAAVEVYLSKHSRCILCRDLTARRDVTPLRHKVQSDISNTLGIPDGEYPPMVLAYRIPADISRYGKIHATGGEYFSGICMPPADT